MSDEPRKPKIEEWQRFEVPAGASSLKWTNTQPPAHVNTLAWTVPVPKFAAAYGRALAATQPVAQYKSERYKEKEAEKQALLDDTRGLAIAARVLVQKLRKRLKGEALTAMISDPQRCVLVGPARDVRLSPGSADNALNALDEILRKFPELYEAHGLTPPNKREE